MQSLKSIRSCAGLHITLFVAVLMFGFTFVSTRWIIAHLLFLLSSNWLLVP